jgi:hypothetical protein
VIALVLLMVLGSYRESIFANKPSNLCSARVGPHLAENPCCDVSFNENRVN